MSDYTIHLNFLPIVDAPSFILFRKPFDTDSPERPHDDVWRFPLPQTAFEDENWPHYWISPDQLDGYERFEVCPRWNHLLTQRFLYLGLRRAIVDALDTNDYVLPRNSFVQEASLIMHRHAEGNETLVLQPYYLKASRKFGFLADFHFRKSAEVEFNRRVQQLSLSLDQSGRRNLDYYVDKAERIKSFLGERGEVLSRVIIPGASGPITLSKDFEALNASRLRSKTYVFGGNREAKNQFGGLKQFGPLHGLPHAPKLLFVFREQDRHAARTLAVTLRGSRFAFPGFQALFKVDLDIDGDPVVINDFSEPNLKDALDRAKKERDENPVLIPVVILPEGDDEGYLRQKAIFVNSEIPTQVCTLRVLKNPDVLKWAVASLALQIFCKAGGQPWKVRPTPSERSLIIGISQSHKWVTANDKRRIDKHFAFSVLTDSSGLFQKIQVLGQSQSQEQYYQELRASLASVLRESADTFRRVVIHTSFRLRRKEVSAIEDTVRTAAIKHPNCQFAVIKVNHRCRFFGINRAVNSLVPFEATQVRLGPSEYLMWFEGMAPGSPNVNKAFPGPTHLEFLRVSDHGSISHDVLLQDLVNLSGANWRGFNAKSAPVSVFYCHLVADLIHDFHERGLPLPAVEDIRPWFL